MKPKNEGPGDCGARPPKSPTSDSIPVPPPEQSLAEKLSRAEVKAVAAEQRLRALCDEFRTLPNGAIVARCDGVTRLFADRESLTILVALLGRKP